MEYIIFCYGVCKGVVDIVVWILDVGYFMCRFVEVV